MKQQLAHLTRRSLVAAILVAGQSPMLVAQTSTDPAPLQRMQGRTTNEQRKAAAANAAARRAATPTTTTAKTPLQGLAGANVAALTFAPGVAAPPGVMNPRGTPDYLSGLVPNWANSPAIRKFVDTLPGLGPQNANNLGNYIPIATKGTFNGDDYYNIGVVEYTQKMHSDLPPTKLRGYKDLAGGDGKAHYLGPVIVAARDKAVRVKFQNQLPTGTAGNLFIPVDKTSMGAGLGPDGTTYTENRAELHLHGGLNPWISDGTPHQWITPAGEATTLKRGLSFADVPDMPATTPGDGTQYYYWSNQQSSRMLFYHDHSYGITRLNVYAGEAAGYIITEPAEDALIAAGTIPGAAMPAEYKYGIPLIIQDKTFVPGPTQLAAQDPTWDLSTWGGYGGLWYPHVYMPNQNPADPTGASAMGRWDYGPWFWPPVPVDTLPPNPATAPTMIPMANGPIYPGPGLPAIPGTPNPSLVPEAFMDTMLVNGTPYPTVTVQPQTYRFRMLNAANDRMVNLSLFQADPANPTEVVMIDATPANAAAAALAPYNAPNWPSDGRVGGVPDFKTMGPSFVVIGNESGFLPTPVVIPPQPVGYEYNRRNIVVLNVLNHGLFLGPAERADVLVDFSAYAGKTLILYNDAPAPVPAFDARLDYFTGSPDQTAIGGAPPTPIGYGPNTRTIMQIKVAAATPAPVFNLPNLNTAFTSTSTTKSAFENTQHPPVVAQAFYNSATNTNTVGNNYATIQAMGLQYTRPENNQVVTTAFQNKAIQELWELQYGRMNATLGVELPLTTIITQTTIPLGYTDPTTEVLTDGTTQLWKITHNGVDTHPVHFHLFDLQVVNRVGWDGAVRFPDPEELGWKETIKMNPLEDIIVAFRPLSPKLPFTLPNSSRPTDVTSATSANVWVTDMTVPANAGAMSSVLNTANNYGWEYVWHCHILGHEENDFMRPMQLNVATTLPAAPTGFTATATGGFPQINLNWVDNATNETGFEIQRQVGAGAFTALYSAVPDSIHYTDKSSVAGTSYTYRVRSYNQFGTSAWVTSAPIAAPTTAAPATGLNVTTSLPSPQNAGTAVTFTAAGTGSTGYQYQFWFFNGTTITMVQDYGVGSTWTMPATTPVANCWVQVRVRTTPGVAFDVIKDVPFVVKQLPATGVSLTTSIPSPATTGTPVTFTAVGLGSANYQYQFWFFNGTAISMVQDYGIGSSWTMPSTTLPASTWVQARVRTTPAVAFDAIADQPFVLTQGPATGLVVTPSLPRPPTPGTAVTFTAAGQGSNNYSYQFWFHNGISWSMVQNYGPSNTWTMPSTTPAGPIYWVQVRVRTTTGVAFDVLQDVSYRLN